MVKQKFASKEYKINGSWEKKPAAGIRGTRLSMDSTNLDRLLNTSKASQYLDQLEKKRSAKADKIIYKLIDTGFTPKTLTWFTPWGPRYKNSNPIINSDDPEVQTLIEMRSIFEKLKSLGYSQKLVLMPADVYATEVNSLDENFVSDYFASLNEKTTEILKDTIDVDFSTWSVMREENSGLYQELKEKISGEFVENESYFWDQNSSNGKDAIEINRIYKIFREFKKAVEVAKFFNPQNAEGSAKKYCIERLVEGILVDQIYDPIKLSLVRKEKDILDGPLKRVYIVKSMAPWLGGE